MPHEPNNIIAQARQGDGFAQPPQAAPTPRRDQYGRPLIIPPGGGKPEPYTRMSTIAKVLDDSFGLEGWGKRNVAVGMAMRPDLVAKALGLHAELEAGSGLAKKEMDSVVRDAEAAAKSNRAANMGTAFHSFTQMLDEGKDTRLVPPTLKPLLDAYGRAIRMAQLRPVMSERFVVIDELKVAGSFDRAWLLPPNLVPGSPLLIGDQKSGATAPEYPTAIAVQLAGYSHGQLYDIETGERTPLGANTEHGLLMHTPLAGPGTTIYTVNLAAGWEALQVSVWVHSVWRKRKDLVAKWLES